MLSGQAVCQSSPQKGSGHQVPGRSALPSGRALARRQIEYPPALLEIPEVLYETSTKRLQPLTAAELYAGLVEKFLSHPAAIFPNIPIWKVRESTESASVYLVRESRRATTSPAA